MKTTKLVKVNGGRITSAKILEDGSCELMIENEEMAEVESSNVVGLNMRTLYDSDGFVKPSDR